MSVMEKEFITFMQRFDACPFEITLHGERHKIGDGIPQFSVVIHKAPPAVELVKSTSLALGEGYMDGNIEIEGDLYQALNLFLGQLGKFSTDHQKLKKLIFTSTSKANQKKEVSSHYDIGNDFYKMWLDETMSYSCGYFEQEGATLYEAQCCKVERILEKLALHEGMTLCDIGCGWGFLLIEAVKKYKVHGVGITLSTEQKKRFEERIASEGLGELLKVELLDYRELPKYGTQFDRIVSVGMVEHVGRGSYEEFMRCAQTVLKPGGLFLLHFISALREYPGDAWIKKYIFPGGVIPSLREMINIAGELGFYTLDVESLRRHYTKTLLCWNKSFQEHRDEVVSMFDERFARMWELYLCACAAVFQNGIVDLHQVLFSNGVNNALPMTRWY
ncbi:MAG: cyclopropane-fatty-acyl-phospholipid synthase family protein [Lachnospiraceae bacterium]|nr:cyclopropane-fatty-acyl-phospholipid synthase family protein [Lachnospiraceae bacterium]